MKYISYCIIYCIAAFINSSYANLPIEADIASASFLVKQDSILHKKLIHLKRINEKDSIQAAIEFGLELADEALEKKLYDIVLETNQILAKAYTKSNNFNRVISYHLKSLKIISLINNSIDKKEKILPKNKLELFKNDSYLQLGSAYQYLGRTERNTILIDSAKFYYNKIIDNNFLVNENSFLKLKAKAYSNFSGIYSDNQEYKKALDFANKAIKIHRNQNNKMSEAAALSNLANIYLYQEDFNSAKEIYKNAIDLIANEKSNLATQYRETMYDNLGYSMYKLKDYKAYEIQELSYDLRDSLRDKEFRTAIERIAYKYEYDKGVKLGRQEEENKRLKARQNFILYAVISIVIMLSLLYWLNIYKLRQKNLGLKLAQTELIQNRNLEKLKSESQTRILNATIDGKESERKEIAETLHDSVSALLSSANLHLQATRKQFNGKTPTEIEKTQKILAEASQKIRSLSHTLVSSVLLKFGLDFAIKDMAEKYSNSQIRIITETKNLRRYHQSFEIKVYNMIQEFVNNILKHSNAKKASISLKEEDSYIFLKVKDDGVGFDKTKITQKDGLGINQIDARVQVMKGNFHIDSSKEKGTVIYVEIPVLEKEDIKLA